MNKIITLGLRLTLHKHPQSHPSFRPIEIIVAALATMKRSIYIALILLNVLCVFGQQYTISVNFLNGNDAENCITGEVPCKTVDYALNNVIYNNTIIRIEKGDQYLTTDTELTDITDIQITGVSNTTINCNTKNAGLSIINVTNILIRNVTFTGCGVLYSDDILYRAGIRIDHTINLTIDTVTITDSKGIGIMILDTAGPVLVTDSTFTDNKVALEEINTIYGGSSLYIGFTRCHSLVYNNCSDDYNSFSCRNEYIITGCNFTGNNAKLPNNKPINSLEKDGPVLESFGRGGGLSIMQRGNSSHNTYIIDSCHFEGNIANFGGGLSIQINDEASHNNISITGTIFSNNNAEEGGGGVQFGFFHTTKALQNNITFNNASFDNNIAVFGGGASVYSSRLPFGVDTTEQNAITFQDCHWYRNEAVVGAAMVLFPEEWSLITDGYLPTPLFIDCTFTKNYISFYTDHKAQFSNGGILFSDTFSINISSTALFHDNEGSAIHMLSGSINVLSNTNMTFTDNRAFRGAGISLMSFSTIVAHENTSILFEGNNASDVGGALYYYSSDNLDYINSKRCFIRYKEMTPFDEWKTNITFINNQAKKYGTAIFAESLDPCIRATNIEDPWQLFNKKSFTFEPELTPLNDNMSYIIATAQKTIEMNQIGGLQMSPNVAKSLDVVIKDDLGQTIDIVLQASCKNSEDEGKVVKEYKYVDISDSYQLALEGRPNTTLDVQLQTIDSRSMGISFSVKLTNCPPGYVLDDSSTRCICSILSNKHIRGIVSCNESTEDGSKHGLLMIGYWAGCNETSGELLTAQCPLGYCDYTKFRIAGLVSLPSTCEELNNNSLCIEDRTGRMCGQCIADHSVHYHSTRFICEECVNPPELGLLFYFISELLPLTILFFVVIAFDISVTSGAVNSFILFAQLLDFFQGTAFDSDSSLQKPLQYLTDAYWFLFGFFNLDFFRLDELSFCLWEGATVLDVLAFKYITTFYGFLLIAILYVLLEYCNCTPLKKCLGRRNADGNYTIVNGMSTILVITYSQVTKVTFQILTLSNINSRNDDSIHVVFLSGETEFFGEKHLLYAIIAIIVLITYTIFLPLLLTGQPLYILMKKILTQKGILQEDATCCCCRPCNRCNNWMTRLSLFCKPTLDASQSCFKDNMRFYGGVFFLYRLFASMSFAFSTTSIAMYILLELVVVIMLTTNAIFQPYQNRFYNIIDTLMFADLAIINGMSLFKTLSNQFFTDDKDYIEIAVIQLVLIYIPVFYICSFLLIKLIAHNSRKARFKLRNINEYIPLYDPELLQKDQQQERERQRLLQSGSLQEDQASNDSFTPNNYPPRLFRPTSGTESESNSQMNRDLRGGGAASVTGRKNQYGAVGMSIRQTK